MPSPVWICLLKGSWVICTNACRIELWKNFLVLWFGISHQRNIVALTVHWVSPLPLHMVFLNPRVCWNPLPCTVLALLGLLPCRLPALSELGDLHKRVQDGALNKAFSYNPHWVLVNMSNMVFFYPRDWWNPLWTFSPFWLDQVFFRVDFLIWTQLGDVYKHVQHWALKIAFSYNSDLILVIRRNILASTVNWVVLASS